jgi:hypothetical protein
MAQTKANTEELEKRLKRISLRMQRGSIAALYEMKKLLDDTGGYQWVEASKQIEPRVFSVMWLLDTVITELWSNLGEDSSGFPKKEGLPYISAISKNLGRFVQQALFIEHEEGIRPFCQAVTKVFELFWLVNDRLMREGIRSDEEWSVL